MNPPPSTPTCTSPLVSIRLSEDKLEIVNQLLLPHVTEYIEIHDIPEAHEAIKSMKIRGAPAIASLAALSISYYLRRSLERQPSEAFLDSAQLLQQHVEQLLDYLFTSRPTAVNLGAAINAFKLTISNDISANKPARDIAQELVAQGFKLHSSDVERNKKMSKFAGQWILQHAGNSDQNARMNVLTVCNTGSLATSGYGTALGAITYLFETQRLDRAYFTQTAPYHQGSRLTSHEFKKLQIPSTMICDTMVGSLFQHRKIDAVVVGADRIARNGDTANKIGTYNAAVLASRHKVPFLVVAPIDTIDMQLADGTRIPIEHRPAIEACTVRGVPWSTANGKTDTDSILVRFTPPDIDVYNPSFDVTPAELITAIVTEKGVAMMDEASHSYNLSSII